MTPAGSSTSKSNKKPAAAAPAKPAKAASAQLPSTVEQWYFERSGRQLTYPPTEKLPIIEVSNFPALGRLTALRFIEWVLANPEGVVSLPTGKTPEYFIKWSKYFLEGWSKKDIQKQLHEVGITASAPPSFKGLHFVQIDEFYPIDPQQQNSFHYYVNKHYLRGFGMDPKRAMLIDPSRIGIPKGHTLESVWPGGKVDLGLRSRVAWTDQEKLQYDVLLAVDQFCSEYEAKIREMGGLGFFLGGIGPDGHIGFNPRGADRFSQTRLTLTNYETEAAAAGDLGGIEISRNRPVITIGLGTITYNPNGVIIVFAAGEAKSRVVADAVQEDKHVRYPATALQGLKEARFYLTHGATIKLVERQLDDILKAEKIDDARLEKAVIDRALALDKRLDQLEDRDAKDDRVLSAALRKAERSLSEVGKWSRDRMIGRITRGLDDRRDETILHTGPHHDDIMLAYMPYVMHLVRNPSNKNYFTVLTSGFTAVTSSFLAEILEDVKEYIDAGEFARDAANGVFLPENIKARAEEVYTFLDGIAARDERIGRRAQARRMVFNLTQVHEDEDLKHIRERVNEHLNYLSTVYAGKKDIAIIQTLKGMQREFEEELIWGYVGNGPDTVFHGRLGFYTGDIFTKAPTLDRDVKPVLALLEKLEPTVVSLAFDPEGTGPDTHYKVLQVLHEALIQYQKKTGKAPTVWGYRNVWHRFHPADANIYIPATLNTLAIMENSFMNCFGSQKNASFPSFEYDGPFCYQAQHMMVDQFQILRTCLGHEWFLDHENPRLRATRGFVYLKEMPLAEFSGNARALAEVTEAAM
jgi:glucosamine-6-phosphate deaminase